MEGELGEYTAYFNGEWVPEDEVTVSPRDRGFLTGDVVYDVERTFNGKSFRMKEHIDRLYRSLKYVRLDPGLSEEQMIEVSEELLRRNENLRPAGGDYMVRQFITRGPGRRTFVAGPPSVAVMVELIDFTQYAPLYDTGAHGVIARTRSYPTAAMEPKLKHQSRMNFNLADLESGDIDPEAWPILMDMEGSLTEGVGYNFFVVTDGILRTPGDQSLLQGVTRGVLFDLAEQLQIDCTEDDLQPYDLYTADEAFFCNTTACVMPMTRADERTIGDGKPGPVTRQLTAAWSEMVGLDIIDQATQSARG